MTKGKFGLSLSAIAVIAFIFAALNQPVAVLLVVGFAFLAEKDEWLNRQVAQAMLLNIVYNLARLVISVIFAVFDTFLDWIDAYEARTTFIEIQTVFNGLLLIGLIALALLAIIKVLGGKEANLPLLSKVAGGDLTKSAAKQVKPSEEASDACVCDGCGAKLEKDAAFCPECGKKAN